MSVKTKKFILTYHTVGLEAHSVLFLVTLQKCRLSGNWLLNLFLQTLTTRKSVFL